MDLHPNLEATLNTRLGSRAYGNRPTAENIPDHVGIAALIIGRYSKRRAISAADGWNRTNTLSDGELRKHAQAVLALPGLHSANVQKAQNSTMQRCVSLLLLPFPSW